VLTRLGRLTGFELDYVDSGYTALDRGKGLLGIETSVDLYRNAKAARKGMAFWLKDEKTFAGLKPSGVKIAFKPVPAPKVGQERWSFAGALTVNGKPPIYGVDIVFRVGALIADVTVTSADPKSGRAIVKSLARKLETRIRQVLSGKVKGPPVQVPGKVKAGPPSNGMDLTAMAIKPADIAGGKIERQGYQLDPDVSPVSEFYREISGSAFAAFNEKIELFHSSTEAAFSLSLMASRLTVNQTAKQTGKKLTANDVVLAKTTNVPVEAGEEARALLTTVRFGDGSSINQGFVLVRVGSIVAFVAVAMPGNVKIPSAAMAGLARVAAGRVAESLRKSGVA
jgi:hypothetical protein